MVDFSKLLDRDREPRKKKSSGGPERIKTIERSERMQNTGRVLARKDPPARGDLSPDQVLVFDSLTKWVEEDRVGEHITLGGYAGTGKTTVVASLAAWLSEHTSLTVVFAAYTGKAVEVLSRKLQAYGIHSPCMTLHSLLYIPVEQKDGQIDWALKPELVLRHGYEDEDPEPIDLVIVDEASMVGEELWRDLRSFGLPIIAVGDHGQLPPVGAGTISLMQKPELRLEVIHRQAEGNPILRLAQHVRRGGMPLDLVRELADDPRVQWARHFGQAAHIVAEGGLDAVGLCYFNNSRVAMNKTVRQARNHAPGDIIIVLRNEKRVVYNGMRGRLAGIEAADEYGRARAVLEFPDSALRITGTIQMQQFGRDKTLAKPGDAHPMLTKWPQLGLLVDYGYVLTVHKSQGSQWDSVVVRCERSSRDTNDNYARWLYTAFTRASENLVVIP